MKLELHIVRLYKGPVFEGCQNRNQMFLYTGHTPLQHYLEANFYQKTVNFGYYDCYLAISYLISFY